MGKKKPQRKKGSSKRAKTTSASTSHQKKAIGKEISRKEEIARVPLKKDINKTTSDIAFTPKKYFIIVKQFLSDARGELKKVTWPTKKELLSATAVVIALVLLIAFYLGIVDLGLVKIIKNVIG